MNDNVLSFRAAVREDCSLFHAWRNENVVRVSSFSEDVIGLGEHREWFEKKITDSNCKMFVLMKNGIPLGQVRFDISGREAEITVSISCEYRGMSYGKRSIRMMSDYIIRSGIADRIVAYIKGGNEVSLRAFRSSGYMVLNKDHVVKGQKAVELEYSGGVNRNRIQ